MTPAKRKKHYRSEALGAIHEAMADLHDAGLLDTTTMREFDTACVTPVEYLTPAKRKKLKAAGWTVGTAAEFLKLSPDDEKRIAARLNNPPAPQTEKRVRLPRGKPA